MKIRIAILWISLMAMSTLSLADSWIRVINESSVPVQAIWQAALCGGVEDDWEGDIQWTVCDWSIIEPGDEARNVFGSLESDRSVKVFTRNEGQVGYCNSMEYSSVTIVDIEGSPGIVKAINNCS